MNSVLINSEKLKDDGKLSGLNIMLNFFLNKMPLYITGKLVNVLFERAGTRRCQCRD